MDPHKIDLIRKLLVLAILIYGVSPDPVLGPFDDVLVIIAGVIIFYALGSYKAKQILMRQ